jgi:hypothetical protein
VPATGAAARLASRTTNRSVLAAGPISSPPIPSPAWYSLATQRNRGDRDDRHQTGLHEHLIPQRKRKLSERRPPRRPANTKVRLWDLLLKWAHGWGRFGVLWRRQVVMNDWYQCLCYLLNVWHLCAPVKSLSCLLFAERGTVKLWEWHEGSSKRQRNSPLRHPVQSQIASRRTQGKGRSSRSF